MNKTAMINQALFLGLGNAMFEEQIKIPTNSGFCEELMKVKVDSSVMNDNREVLKWKR